MRASPIVSRQPESAAENASSAPSRSARKKPGESPVVLAEQEPARVLQPPGGVYGVVEPGKRFAVAAFADGDISSD